MGQFEDRLRAFEKKYEMDQETRFKVMARMSHLFGLWAAEQMELKGREAEEYAGTVVDADMEKPGHLDLIEKVEGDFKAKNVNVSRHRMEREIEACYSKAREQMANIARE